MTFKASDYTFRESDNSVAFEKQNGQEITWKGDYLIQ